MPDDAAAAYALVLHGDATPPSGGVAIAGFSTVGMVGVIAASHVIKGLGLKQLGTVLHGRFPAIALIHDEVPKHPVRVYQGEDVGVFTAEIQFPNEHDVQFGNTVLEWTTKGGYDHLFIVDGIVQQDLTARAGTTYGVASTKSARQALRDAGIEQIQQGVVAGIPGYLLSEGDRLGLAVTALLVECNPMYPDARAAALAIEAIGELTGLDVPLEDLLADAREIESRVQEMFDKTRQMLPAPEDEAGDRADPMVG